MRIKIPVNPLLVLLVLVLLLGGTQFWPSSHVLANPDKLQIDGGIVQREVTPGEKIEHVFTVQSNPNDPELEMTVEAAGFGQGLDGSYQAISADEDASPRSAREFITSIDKPSFTLKPGASGAQQVTVEIQVPETASAGGYYAIIYVHSQPAGEGSVGVVLAANIPVVLTVNAAGRTTGGEITEVVVEELEDGNPIKVGTIFRNTGNYHYRASNRVTISDGEGNWIAEDVTPLTGVSILPNYSHRFETSFLIVQGLEEGEYRITSEVIGDDGMVKGTLVTGLQVGWDYNPFGGIAEASLHIFDITTTGEPQEIICDSAGVHVVLSDTTAGEQGKVVIGQYEEEPGTAIRFSAPDAEGGMNKHAVRFVDVYMEGISRGTARISVYYAEEEVTGFDENSLFVSYWDGRVWRKADSLSVFTGAGCVGGDIPIRQLGGTVIAIGGDKTSGAGGLPVALLIGIAVALVVFLTIVLLMILKLKRS